MFAEIDRVHVRHFLGFAAIFKQADPLLENALTAIQSIADDGSQPDSTSENAVRAIIVDLLEVECMLKALWKQLQVGTVGKVKMDALRGMSGLRSEGRRLVTSLSTVLATYPRRDVFGPSQPRSTGNAFYDNPDAKNYQW